MGIFKEYVKLNNLEELCETLEWFVENNIELDADILMEAQGGQESGVPKVASSLLGKIKDYKSKLGKKMKNVPLLKKLKFGGEQDAKLALKASGGDPNKARQSLQKRFQIAVQALRKMGNDNQTDNQNPQMQQQQQPEQQQMR